MPRSLSHQTLPDGLAEDLGEKISRGVFKQGARLPTVAELARTYGVSQSVVREALSRLRSQGLIETRHGSGSVVLEQSARRHLRFGRKGAWDVQALSELFALRADIEAMTAAHAAAYATKDDVQKLREAIDHLERHLEDKTLGPDADFAFHSCIADATHNRYRSVLVQHLHREVRQAIAVARENTSMVPGLAQRVHAEHVAVLRAIEAKDPQQAARAMRAHLVKAARRLGLPTVGLRARKASF